MHGKSRKKHQSIFIRKRPHGGNDPEMLLNAVMVYANQHDIHYTSAKNSEKTSITPMVPAPMVPAPMVPAPMVSRENTTKEVFLGLANASQTETEWKALTDLNILLQNVKLPKVVNELRYADEKKWMDTSFQPSEPNTPFCIETCNYKTRLFYPETTDLFDQLHNAFYIWYKLTERIEQTNRTQPIAKIRTILEDKTKNDFNNLQLEMEKTRKKAKNAFLNTAMKHALQLHKYATKNVTGAIPDKPSNPTKALEITTKALEDIRTMLDNTINDTVSTKAFTVVTNGLRAFRTTDTVNSSYINTFNNAMHKLYSAEIKRKLSANAEPKYSEMYDFSEILFGMKEDDLKHTFKQFLFLVYIQNLNVYSLNNDPSIRWKTVIDSETSSSIRTGTQYTTIQNPALTYTDNPMLPTVSNTKKTADANYIRSNADNPANIAQYAIGKKDVHYMSNTLLDFVSQFATITETTLKSNLSSQTIAINGSMFLFVETIKSTIQIMEKELVSITRASFGSASKTNADNVTNIVNILFHNIHKPLDGNQKATITAQLLKIPDNLQGEDAKSAILGKIESISTAKSGNPKTTIFQETKDSLKFAIEQYEPVNDFRINEIKSILRYNTNAETIVNILFRGISTSRKIKAIQYAIHNIQPTDVSKTNRQNIVNAINKLHTENILEENEANRIIRSLPFAVSPVEYNMTTIQSLLVPSSEIIDNIASYHVLELRHSVLKLLEGDTTPEDEQLFRVFHSIVDPEDIKIQTNKITDTKIRSRIKTSAIKYAYKASTIHSKIRDYISSLPYAIYNALFEHVHNSQRAFIRSALDTIPNETTGENAKISIISAIERISNIPENIRTTIVTNIRAIPVIETNYTISNIKLLLYNAKTKFPDTRAEAIQIVDALFHGVEDANKMIYIMKAIYDGEFKDTQKLEHIIRTYTGVNGLTDPKYKPTIQAMNRVHQYSVLDNANIIDYVKDVLPEMALRYANIITAKMVSVASSIAISSLFIDDPIMDATTLPAKVKDTITHTWTNVKTKLNEIKNVSTLSVLRQNANTVSIRKAIEDASVENAKQIQKYEYAIEYLKTNSSDLFDKQQYQTILDVTTNITTISRSAVEDHTVKHYLYPDKISSNNKDMVDTYRKAIVKDNAVQQIVASIQSVLGEYANIQETASKIWNQINDQNERSKYPNIIKELEMIQAEKLSMKDRVPKGGGNSVSNIKQIPISGVTPNSELSELTKDIQSQNKRHEISHILPFMLQVYESLYQDSNYNGTTKVQSKPISNKIIMQYVIDKIREIERTHPRPDLFNTVYYFWNMFDLSVALQYIQAYASEISDRVDTSMQEKANEKIVTRIEKQLGSVPTFELWDKKKEKTEKDFYVYSVVKGKDANAFHKAESDILAMSYFPNTYNASFQKRDVYHSVNPSNGELQSELSKNTKL
jgi:hypothetical protein